ncbi:unnamed protein product [Arctia plantaginis]|uniref:Uncharacterized protein n=1 Tax=Arctia plantaginis TaxID=874455 RepID=A0A8S1A0P8_ARCPL|nr:unnamed protein product [Arctia plantaginis]
MKRRDIFDIWLKVGRKGRNNLIIEKILKNYDIEECNKPPRSLQMLISSLTARIQYKWEKYKRNKIRFLAENADWLEEEVLLPSEFLSMVPSCSGSTTPPTRHSGRPERPFEICHIKVKKRKLKELVTSKSQEELTLATQMKLVSSGKRDAANIVKEISLASPSRATKIKKARAAFTKPEPKLSPEAALGILVDAKLSVEQYKILRKGAKAVNSNLYPAYYLVQEAKTKCYPPEDSIEVTDTYAEIKLQALLNLTSQRICEVQQDVIEQHCTSECSKKLRLISKWGCDGSSAQSRYKQRISGEGLECSDEHMFSVSLVPLRLIQEDSNNIIWQNPRPNSTRFCRMIRFSYKKETKEVIKSEVNIIKTQISKLVPSQITIHGINLICSHDLVFTMVDGKICSTLSQYDSTQKCYICGKPPKKINTDTTDAANEDMYSFGISPLHSWIRAYECLLHIAYKSDIKTWQARTKEDKESVASRKKHIQERFFAEMGLLVDMPKQSAGNTNDGNTARRFFRNSKLTADITGINLDLIKRFHVILEALSCELEIDPEKFKTYAKETKKLYLVHYSWYYMPCSIHKILDHSKEIIETCVLPLGQLAEEAQEANNKEYRRNREYFSRKMSRINTNRDVLNRFLIVSDPLLSSKSTVQNRKRHALPSEPIALLKAPNMREETSSTEEDE